MLHGPGENAGADSPKPPKKPSGGGFVRMDVEGLPLIKTVDKRLAFDLELFSRGGLRVLEKIEQQNYNVLAARPAISKFERVQLLVGSLWNTL